MRTKFQPGIMLEKYGRASYTTTPERAAAVLPTFRFFWGTAFGPLFWLWQKARASECDDAVWNYGSVWLGDLFESLGGKIKVDGLENLTAISEPCVFIANHNSALETFLLPAMIRPLRPVTFVVKRSLTTMPVFGPVMRSRDPVIVDRKNPRADLMAVLEEGTKRLKKGISIIVFPQHTRSLHFDESQFNTIGIKLARKAGVPVLPIALKTDVWGQGKKIKELGSLKLDLPARFKFGRQMRIDGTGKSEHAEICRFIGETVRQWQAEDGINS